MAWFNYPITVPHSSDDGVDIGTPNDTPLTMPFGGKVIDASYHDYGGQVVVDVPGTGYSEYEIHLDRMFVHPGEDVQPGQVIGYSGGGVGDLVLHDGRVQPAQSQSWYHGHSSTYHTEYGLFEGDTMNQVNQGWGNPSRQLDPTGVLDALQMGHQPNWPGSTPPSGSPTGSPTGQPQAFGLPNPIDPTGWPNAIAKGMGFTNAGNMLQRMTVGAAGVGAIALGVWVAMQPEVQAAGEKAAGVAAKVGAAAA